MALTVPGANININNFNATLVKFETNVVNYSSFRSTTVPGDVAKNVQSIRTWVDEQVASSKEESRNQAISDVGKVLETSINSLQALTSGEPVNIMKGCLSIAGSVATVVGGPYGAAAGALCGILGSVLSLSTPNEPDLATVFMQKVHAELQKFNQKLQSQTFEGLQRRVQNMSSNLETLKSASKDEELPDTILYETDFPQFIGEVSRNITNGLNNESKEEDIDDCLRSMVVYCNAQTSLLLLLANVLATFKATGRQTMFIQNLLSNQKKDANQKLEFLSDEKYMNPLGALPTEGGKIWMILHLRRNLPCYEIVEEFRGSLGMTKMPELDTIRKKVYNARFLVPKDITCLYEQPQKRGDNHYFQLINHTDFPIKVVCDGLAGDYFNGVNGLKFRQDVDPRSSYEHIATKSGWNFSTGGFFIIYLDGSLRSDGNMFEGRNLKVFEFALSNPFIGFKKSAILEKTHNLLSVTGQDCWKQMESYKSPDIYFVHNKKYYVVFGGVTGTIEAPILNIQGPRHRGVPPPDMGMVTAIEYKAAMAGVKAMGNMLPMVPIPGKNGCHTWRFVVQEFDPLEDILTKSCKIS